MMAPDIAAERMRRMRARRRNEPATTSLMFERANWEFEGIGRALYDLINESAAPTTRGITQEAIRQRAAMLTGGGCA